MTLPAAFECPKTMRRFAERVAAGEYALPPGYAVDPATVLDIGAAVGDFAFWAHGIWPGAAIDSYEPNPETAAMLRRNVAAFMPGAVRVHELAVRGVPWDGRLAVPLYSGRNNVGESSMLRGSEQTDEAIEVDSISAAELHSAHVVKVDTEGLELPILEHLNLDETLVVLLEWHTRRDRWKIGALLCDRFDCVRDEVTVVDHRTGVFRGIQAWVRS